MTFLKYSFITLISLVLIGSAGYLLAASGIQSKPGYAKLALPSGSSTNTILALNLGAGGLKPTRWLIERVLYATDGQLELSEQLIMTALRDLEGVQLRIYEVEDNRPVFEQAINDSVVLLKRENWQTLIKAREESNRIVVMQSGDEHSISGLTVLVSTPENAVFINLMGEIDPESISAIAESLN